MYARQTQPVIRRAVPDLPALQLVESNCELPPSREVVSELDAETLGGWQRRSYLEAAAKIINIED